MILSFVARYHIFLCITSSLKISDFNTKLSFYKRKCLFLKVYGCKLGTRQNPGSMTISFLVFYIQTTLAYFKIRLKQSIIDATLVLKSSHAIRFEHCAQANINEGWVLLPTRVSKHLLEGSGSKIFCFPKYMVTTNQLPW